MNFTIQQKFFILGSAGLLVLLVAFYSFGFLKAADDEGIGLIDGTNAVKVCVGGACYAGPALTGDKIKNYILGQVTFDNLTIGSTYDELKGNLEILNQDRQRLLSYLDLLNGKKPSNIKAAESQAMLVDVVVSLMSDLEKKCDELSTAIDKLPEPQKPEPPKPMPNPMPMPQPQPMPNPPANPIIMPNSNNSDLCAGLKGIDLIECNAKKAKCDKLFGPVKAHFYFDFLYGKCKKKTEESKEAVSKYIEVYTYEKSICPGKTDPEVEKCDNAKLDTKLAKEELFKDCGCGAMGLNAFVDMVGGSINYELLGNYMLQDLDKKIFDLENQLKTKQEEIDGLEGQIKDKQKELDDAKANPDSNLSKQLARIKKIKDDLNNLTFDLNGKIKELADLESQKKTLEDEKKNGDVANCIKFAKDAGGKTNK